MLTGITVIDLTHHLAGPFCTQLLGDLGARVIKFESLSGDPTRANPPHYIEEQSAYFLSVSRNKESVALNLKSAEGRELLLSAAAKADVVVDNFRPGVMDRLGLSREALAAANPSIVQCSITGFGSSGTDARRPAFDMVVEALSGVMSVTGHPGGPPARSGVPIGDVAAGLYAALGIVSALVTRSPDSRDLWIDVAMYDCQLALLSYLASYFLNAGEVPGPQGSGHRSNATYRTFTCAGGELVAVAASSEAQWRGLCAAAKEPIADEARFAGKAARLAHRRELDEILEAAFRRLTRDEALARLEANDVPSAPVRDVAAALSDPATQRRGMITELMIGGHSRARVVGNPIKTATTRGADRFPSAIGADTSSVLRGLLGLTVREIAALAARGVIRPVQPDPCGQS